MTARTGTDLQQVPLPRWQQPSQRDGLNPILIFPTAVIPEPLLIV
jgi:hypothetical protein